jgi:ATP-dependent DNA helicase DinG
VTIERLALEAREAMRREIAAAAGREVSFVGGMDADGRIVTVRAVARGTIDAVLALPGVAGRGEILLHNHPSGVLEPSGADLSVAATLHDGGVGFGIVDNEVTDLYVVVEVPRARAVEQVDPVAIAGSLGRNGIVARALGGDAYEDRPSQRDMAAYTADVYNEGGVALVEAGTGVGKSFAYLVPAIEWARTNHERTVVSTNTINLQEQLVGKDLPALARAFAADGGPAPTYALLKGWRNYLCLARLQSARHAEPTLLEDERAAELDALAGWAERTPDGSLSDLPDQPSDEVWDEVAAESDLCTRLQCPHFNQCFVFQARRRAAEADVVVVNHHLLTSDLAVRIAQDNWQDAAVLPPYRRLVLDEAHHVEDTAAVHLGTQVTQRGVIRLFNRLERNGRGLLPTLLAELARKKDQLSSASFDLVRQSLIPELHRARRHAEQLFGLLADRIKNETDPVLRLRDDFSKDPIWTSGELGMALDNLFTSLSAMRQAVETIADRLGLDEPAERRVQLLGELRGVLRRFDAIVNGLNSTLRPSTDQAATPAVRWLERRGGKAPYAALSTVPLDLAPLLKEHLFDRVETVVLTSATLAAGRSFGFLEARLGLDRPPSRVKVREILPSPFDYGAQCLLGIPTDLPGPSEDAPGHDEAVVRAVTELSSVTDGGMFVLFTSHGQLRRVASRLRPRLAPERRLLVQGEAQRDRLLRDFREFGNAVLLGTDSFWEGVDVPGRALRLLILAKLPFRVPTEPLTAARLERLEEQGVDGFRNYLLPLAALKLKQGFGRLIRTRLDVGAVLLLDSRAASKNYSRVVLDGLPPATRVIGSWEQVRSACEEFFAVADARLAG